MTLGTRAQALLERADGWSERTRAWMITIVAACCVGIFLAIWAVYAATHVNTRYVQAAPGESATLNDVTYRVLDIRRTETVLDGDEEHPAAANAIWIVVDAEVQIPHPVEVLGCGTIPLVAVGDRTWEASNSFYSRDGIPVGCTSDEVPVGRPYRFQQFYEVPVKYADQVYGIAVEDVTNGDPAIVLTPPAR